MMHRIVVGMAVWTHLSGLAISNGRIYVVTYDSNVYAFGLKSEQ